MAVLIIDNYPDTPLGQIARALEEANISYTVVKAHAGQPVPEATDGFDGLAVFGGAQNALDDEGHPYLPSVCDLIRAFHDEQKPVLGICLGSQLIARAFGAQNILGRPVEFGWQEVRPTAAGAEDPLVSKLGAGAPLFHWHSDTYSIPEGAVHLASSDLTPHQAFRIGQTTYAIQFHFEVSRQEAAFWSENFADVIAEFRPEWSEQHQEHAVEFGERADETGMEIARAWVALL